MKIKEGKYIRKFRCARCGYLTQRQAPPKDCPICRSRGDSFEDIGVERPIRSRAFLIQN